MARGSAEDVRNRLKDAHTPGHPGGVAHDPDVGGTISGKWIFSARVMLDSRVATGIGSGNLQGQDLVGGTRILARAAQGVLECFDLLEMYRHGH